MNNQKVEASQEYHHVASSVEHHDSKDMIAKTTLVTHDGVSKDVITDNVANRVIKTEIMTANESSGLSDDDIDIKVESLSDWDPRRVKEDEVFSHQDEWHMEMQQNKQIKSQNVLEGKQLLFVPPVLHLVSTEMSIHQHPVLLGTAIQVNIDDSGSKALPLSTNKSVLSSLPKDTAGGSECQSNISSNKRDAETAFVEQPSNLPSMCFVCGHRLSNPNERFYYLKSQKLINSQISLLELLSDVLNQVVVTTTSTVDLCSRCSRLIDETDSVYACLKLLKKKICKLFVDNQSTKLTYLASPNACNLRSTAMNPVPIVYQPPDLNLDDLATIKRKFGRQPKIIQSVKKMTSELSSSNPPVQVKRKRGRPRKPFGCHMCILRFTTKSMMLSHMMREHKVSEEFGRVRSEAAPALGVEEDGKSEKINQENLQIQQEQEDYTGKSTILETSDPLEIEPSANIQSTNTTKSVKDPKTGLSSISTEPVRDSKTGLSSTTTESVRDSKTGHSSTSTESVRDSKTGLSSTSTESVRDSKTALSSTSTECVRDSKTGHSSTSTESVRDSKTGHSSTSTESVRDSKTGFSSTSSPNSVKRQKTGMDVTKQLLASMRPIQPKPQTVIRTAQDGSMVLLMNPPAVVDSPPKGINVSPGYINHEPGPYACETRKKIP